MIDSHYLAPVGSTTVQRYSLANMSEVWRAAVQFTIESVGATPAISWTVQGSLDGSRWYDLEYLTPDSAVAASKAAITSVTTGVLNATLLYLDGLDRRFFKYFAVNVSANTNCTFNAQLHIARD